MYCRKCGQEIDNDAKFCPYCKEETNPAPQKNAAIKKLKNNITITKLKKKSLSFWGGLGAVIVGIIFVISYFAGRCEASGCNNKAEYGDYCIRHVCLYRECTRQRGYNSSYCYLHEEDDEDYSSAIYDLDFSNIKIETNSSYTICTGKVTNNGSRTYKFVEVKGAFKDRSGNVVDTDWTYAVGSEGLAPGESTTFRLSVDKDYSIDTCSVSILDYD